MQIAGGIGGYLMSSCCNRCEQLLSIGDVAFTLKVRNLLGIPGRLLPGDHLLFSAGILPRFFRRCKVMRQPSSMHTRNLNDGASLTHHTPGLVDLDAAFPAQREQPGLHKGSQGRRQRITVEVDGLADVGPEPACWRCLHEGHDLVYFRNMILPLSITALNPRHEALDVHHQYVCLTHIL